VPPDLRDADLRGADLSYADLGRAFAKPNAGEKLTHPKIISKWIRADLTGANLAGAKLLNSTLEGALLVGATVDGARMDGTRLTGAFMQGARLLGAHLIDADLTEANLEDADFSEAILTNVILHGAGLSGAVFDHADFLGVTLNGVDLSATKALDTVHHRGPSYIGIETVYQSGGNISDLFLRGAGIPENFITFMKSLTSSALEFYSCFISYSNKDQQVADRLRADLQSNGVRCWFAPHDIQAGKKIHEQIDQAIRLYDRLLLILSEASMNSEWVKTEIAHARRKELTEKRQVLFPISLVPFEKIRQWEYFDADIGKSSAREIREYFIPDFSNWKDHDAYQVAFQRLVRDLKAQGKAGPANSDGRLE
jgi:uncharacterized protein YjbI with pentapeptide repeats